MHNVTLRIVDCCLTDIEQTGHSKRALCNEDGRNLISDLQIVSQETARRLYLIFGETFLQALHLLDTRSGMDSLQGSLWEARWCKRRQCIRSIKDYLPCGTDSLSDLRQIPIVRNQTKCQGQRRREYISTSRAIKRSRLFRTCRAAASGNIHLPTSASILQLYSIHAKCSLQQRYDDGNVLSYFSSVGPRPCNDSFCVSSVAIYSPLSLQSILVTKLRFCQMKHLQNWYMLGTKSCSDVRIVFDTSIVRIYVRSWRRELALQYSKNAIFTVRQENETRSVAI